MPNAWSCNVTLLCIEKQCMVKTCCARKRVTRQSVSWVVDGEVYVQYVTEVVSGAESPDFACV